MYSYHKVRAVWLMHNLSIVELEQSNFNVKKTMILMMYGILIIIVFYIPSQLKLFFYSKCVKPSTHNKKFLQSIEKQNVFRDLIPSFPFVNLFQSVSKLLGHSHHQKKMRKIFVEWREFGSYLQIPGKTDFTFPKEAYYYD